MDLRTIMTYGEIFRIFAIIVLLSLSITELVLTTKSQSFFNDARQAMSDTNQKILDYLEFKKNRTSIERIDSLLTIIPWKIFLEASSLIISPIYCIYKSRTNAKANLRKAMKLTLAIMKIGEWSVTILMLHYLHVSSTYILNQNLDVQSYFDLDQYSLSITLLPIISITHIGLGLKLVLIAGISQLIQFLKTRNSHSQFENETSFTYPVDDIERGCLTRPILRESGDNTELMISFNTESSLINQNFDESIEITEAPTDSTTGDTSKTASSTEAQTDSSSGATSKTASSTENPNDSTTGATSKKASSTEDQTDSSSGDTSKTATSTEAQTEDLNENRKLECDSVFSEEDILAHRVRDSIPSHSTSYYLRSTSMLSLSSRKK